jgi:pimeloyl-ACP methyl ester carboxylesterase
VLVHGAWADSSSWTHVIRRLRAGGYPVHAIANPLQGVVSDTAYLSSYLTTIVGPVVLVEHSYGGALITNVFPIRGETVGQLAAQSSPPLPLVSVDVPGAQSSGPGGAERGRCRAGAGGRGVRVLGLHADKVLPCLQPVTVPARIAG